MNRVRNYLLVPLAARGRAHPTGFEPWGVRPFGFAHSSDILILLPTEREPRPLAEIPAATRIPEPAIREYAMQLRRVQT